MCSGGGGEGKQWSCGKAGVVSLQKVGSLVRDLSEPCLSQSHIQVVITVSSFSFLPPPFCFCSFLQMKKLWFFCVCES